tara:strand:- start:59765 stop:60577 length:813 start_codon:yes stop_codon:yes gene_type:complete
MGNCLWRILLLVSTLFLSCAEKNPKTPDVPVPSLGSTVEIDHDSIFNDKGERIIFKASGNEPFWGVEISEKSMMFTSLMEGLESFNAPYRSPIRAMDANIKTYISEQGPHSMGIMVEQLRCVDDMSGRESSYRVEVRIREKDDREGITFSGCGNYRTDYRLNDLWILEEMQGKKIKMENFQKDLPYMEINSSENTLMGHAGCNRMQGKIFSEGPLLRFSQISLTRMVCGMDNQEAEFLKYLRSSTTYSIENNRLSLENPDGIALVFKKVD